MSRIPNREPRGIEVPRSCVPPPSFSPCLPEGDRCALYANNPSIIPSACLTEYGAWINVKALLQDVYEIKPKVRA